MDLFGRGDGEGAAARGGGGERQARDDRHPVATCWRSLLLHIGDEQSLQAGTMHAQDCAWLGVDMDVTHAPLIIGWPSYLQGGED